MEKRILRLLIVALGFILLLVVGLSILFTLALKDVKHSIQVATGTKDIVDAIHSLKVINGVDGKDGLSIVGPAGRDGKDSISTLVIQQQPIKGDKGDKGDSAPPSREIEFDGHGNWRYKGDEEWLPLNQDTPPGAE